MKKWLSFVLVIAMVLSLCACGSSSNQTQNQSSSAQESSAAADSSSEEATESKTFQFEGKFEEAGSYASFLNNAFLLTLNADGTCVCDKYAFANYDASDADSNETYTQSYLSGTWKEVEKDGVECLQIKLAYVDANGNESNATTNYAYDIAGEYSFDMTFPVTPGQSYTRTVTMTGKEGNLYDDDNAFIAAYAIEFVAPESVATFVDSENNATAYLQEDGTMLLYAGYDQFAEGKWSAADGAVSVSVDGNALEVTNDGQTASFSVDRTIGDSTVTYNLVCEDTSALVAAAPAASDDAPYTVTVDLGGNETTASLTLNEDGTGVLNVFMDFAVSYTQIGNAVILEPTEELADYAAQIWPAIKHVYILNEDKSMLPIENVYEAGDLVLYLLDEENLRAEMPSYSFAKDGFTYVLNEEGTEMTVTAPSEEDLGAFAQVWQAMGAEKWTLEEHTATAVN